MKLVRQLPGDMLCGHCTVAMITGKSLFQIIQEFGHTHTTTLREVKSVLIANGYQVGDLCTVDNRKKRQPLPPLSLVRIDVPGRKIGHLVVYNEGVIYDSNIGVFSSLESFMESYRMRGNWRIRHIMEVAKL